MFCQLVPDCIAMHQGCLLKAGSLPSTMDYSLQQKIPVPPAGFEAAVADFEQWVPILLLEALQRAGHFKAVGESMTAAALKGKCHHGYTRFVDEALSTLCIAGQPSPRLPLQHA